MVVKEGTEPGLAFPRRAAGVTQRATRKRSETLFITHNFWHMCLIYTTLFFLGIRITESSLFSAANTSLLINIPTINLLHDSE